MTADDSVAQNTVGAAAQSIAKAPLRQDERQALITELVLSEGSIRIDQIVAQFDVSRMTIHRDLDALEARGILRKSRGAVTAVSSSLFEASTDYRIRQNVDAKEAIARIALEMIEPGQAIVLDDSTTGLQLAQLLPQRAPLTVITNFGRVAEALRGQPDISLISTGGEYYQLCDAYKGALTLSALRQLSADIYFMSAPAITNGVCFHQHPELVLVKQAMFTCARTRVLVVDHTKFQRRALHAMTPVEDFDYAIVDSLTTKEDLGTLRRAGVEVRIAQVRTTPRKR